VDMDMEGAMGAQCLAQYCNYVGTAGCNNCASTQTRILAGRDIFFSSRQRCS